MRSLRLAFAATLLVIAGACSGQPAGPSLEAPAARRENGFILGSGNRSAEDDSTQAGARMAGDTDGNNRIPADGNGGFGLGSGN